MTELDYGAGGRVGIGTPQANPTVEPEFQRLLPTQVASYTVRLTSAAKHPRDRLIEYIENLDGSLERFDTLPLNVFAFACTGSSYLVGAAREAAITTQLEVQRGYPIITAAQAIHRKLSGRGVKRIAIVAPYPEWLVEKGRAYWEGCGYHVAVIDRLSLNSADTRSIYDLSSRDALQGLERIADQNVDAIVFTGTGMPTIDALSRAHEFTNALTCSSNSALVEASLAHLTP